MQIGAAETGPWAGGGLAALARGMLRDEAGWSPGHGLPGLTAAPGIVLSLADMQPDEAGACVLEGDGIAHAVLLETDDSVVAQGRGAPRAVAAGADVSGHRFITFASGVTVYFPSGIELAVSARAS